MEGETISGEAAPSSNFFFFVIYKIIWYLLFLKFTTYLLFFFWLPGIFLPCPVFSCGMQASIVAEHRLSCLMVHGILPPWPELEPASPAMEGGFSTTRPPGKSPSSVICWDKRKAEIMARLKKQGKGDPWQDRSKWHKSLKPELSLLAQQSASKKAVWQKKNHVTQRERPAVLKNVNLHVLIFFKNSISLFICFGHSTEYSGS